MSVAAQVARRHIPSKLKTPFVSSTQVLPEMNSTPMLRNLTLGFLLLSGAAAHSATYTFTTDPATETARVTVKVAKPSGTFHMPAWAPGDYELFNYGKFTENIEFRLNGQVVAAQRSENLNNWTIPGNADEVSYTQKPSRGNFSINLRVKPDHTFVSGPGVFGWFGGHADEQQELRITLNPAGAKVYSTLDQKTTPTEAILTAPDLDEMLDAPFVMGSNIQAREFTVHGKPHLFVAFNQHENANLDGFVKVGTIAAEQAYKLFGELPYHKYIFFGDFGGGLGGLEHKNSTRLGLGRGSTGEGVAGFIFHEYVHTYNVKRIRAEALGPFDYTKPAITGTLWWLEGTTDYYADILMARGGLQDRQNILRELGATITSLAQTPARLKLSVDESSRRIWETRGSGGFGGLNYYHKGKVLGVFLDLAIRGHSKGKYSLDNVIVDLYKETKPPKPGYKESRIRELCVKYGGAALGQLYDEAAMQAVDVPFEKVLPLVGLKLQGGHLVDDPAASAEARAIGAVYPAPVG